MINETVMNEENEIQPDKLTNFGMKKRTRIGIWNVRTLLHPSRLEQLCKEFQNYKLALLGISELRWSDAGEHITSDGLTLLYSGRRADEVRASGVGFLLSKETRRALVSWKPCSDRIITATFNTRARRLTCVQCYAPTETSERSIKDAFYRQLERVLATVNRGDILMVIGDFNAQVGAENSSMESTMGRHGLGRMTENGELFTEMCTTNSLVIGGTLFPHKRIHKVTWISSDHVTENQIDHITISRKWRGSLLDVRNKRGADIASDHHLVIATLQMKVAAIRKNKSSSRVKFDINKLKDPGVAKKYTETLESAMPSYITSPEYSWTKLEHLLVDTAVQSIGFKEKGRKEWMSEETWKLVEERKAAKSEINASKTRLARMTSQEKHSNLDRAVKKSARRDKRRWAENIAKDAQKAAETNRSRDLYGAIRRLTKTPVLGGKPLKDDNGEITTSKDEQMQLWTDFYRNMLAQTPNTHDQALCDCESHEVNQNITTECPSIPEICEAIKALKNNKSPGLDNIPPELLLADPMTSSKLLLPLMEGFWSSNYLPDSLLEGVIIKIPKKGDLSERSNWRGITLLNMLLKVIAHIIRKRIYDAISPGMRKEQAGFRRGKSCVDHVNSLRIIVEQSVEWRSPLYLLFIDFEKAFDTLNHTAIWNALACKGVPQQLISLIKSIYANATCRILHENELSDKINIGKGVRQGCVLSPLLFNIVLDVIMQQATTSRNGIVWGLVDRLEDLDYADDICLLTHSHAGMEHKLRNIVDHALTAGLKINIGKTKIMRIFTENNTPFHIGGTQLEEVESFCYLGSIIDRHGGSSADISARVKKARQAFGMLTNVWKSSNISQRTKFKIFNSNVKSVLLYGCETWNAASSDVQSLQVFTNNCLRRLLKIYWPNTISNSRLWETTQQIPIQKEICKRKWKWIGHTLRKDDNDIAKQAIEWNPQGSRRRGRPAHTWKRQIDAELTRVRRSWRETKTIASDRSEWNELVTALCSL